MQWIDSTISPFKNGSCREILVFPGAIAFGWAIYSVVTGGGFLYTVGLSSTAIYMALVPAAFAFLFVFCLVCGYSWEIACCMKKDPAAVGSEAIPSLLDWKRYIIEGIQFILFYLLIITFFSSLAALFHPYSTIVILFLLIAFHPLFVAPLLFSAEDKSFLGLLDGCLDVLKLTEDRSYLTLWLNATLYIIIHGGIILPLASVMLGITGIGIFFIPGIYQAFIMGYYHLFLSLTEDKSAKKATSSPFLIHPFILNQPSVLPSSVQLRTNPFSNLSNSQWGQSYWNQRGRYF